MRAARLTGERYRDECLHMGLHGSKPAFKSCFWRYRQRLYGLGPSAIHGPPRGTHPPPANLSSGASYRVYMSCDGVLNNLLSWPPPNHYAPGDL